MSSDSERVAELFEQIADKPVRPGGAVARPKPRQQSVGHRYVTEYAPPMPESFWGKVSFAYQSGQLVNITVEETLRP